MSKKIPQVQVTIKLARVLPTPPYMTIYGTLNEFINQHWDGHMYFYRSYGYVDSQNSLSMKTSGLSIKVKQLKKHGSSRRDKRIIS